MYIHHTDSIYMFMLRVLVLHCPPQHSETIHNNYWHTILLLPVYTSIQYYHIVVVYNKSHISIIVYTMHYFAFESPDRNRACKRDGIQSTASDRPRRFSSKVIYYISSSYYHDRYDRQIPNSQQWL